MTPTKKVETSEIEPVDDQLVAEFAKLVREVSAEIARQAVAPHLEQTVADIHQANQQTVVGIAEANKHTIELIKQRVSGILEQDRQQLLDTLQAPIREVVAAYKGAQDTLALLASSSRLVDDLELLARQLDEVREAVTALKEERQRGEQLLDEGRREVLETMRCLERRIPDAARVLDETAKNRETLGALVEELHRLISDVRDVVARIEEALLGLMSTASEELQVSRRQLVQELVDVGNRLTGQFDNHLQRHYETWSKSLVSLRSEVQEVQGQVQRLRDQLKRHLLVSWLGIVIVGGLAVWSSYLFR